MRNREYEVQEILDYRNKRGVREYQIKWKGYSLDQCTWQPEENLTCCREMLHQFKIEVGLGFEEEESAADDDYKPKRRAFAARSDHGEFQNDKLSLIEGKRRNEQRRSPQKQRELFIYQEDTAPNGQQSSEQYLSPRMTKKTGKSDKLHVTKMLVDQRQEVYFQVQTGGEKKTMKRDELLQKNVLAVLNYYQGYYQISSGCLWT